MKKPMSLYETSYPVNETSCYYGDCETGNNSCDKCNSGDNSAGSGNGSGNSGSVSSWN